MAYCTQDDILQQLSSDKLITLTSETGDAADSDIVTRAIEDADATIDTYCQARYTVPLDPVPTRIREVSVDVSIYNLYSRRDDMIPYLRKDRHKEAIRFLEKVSEGKIELGASTPAPTNTGDTVDITYNDRIFTRTKMGGF